MSRIEWPYRREQQRITTKQVARALFGTWALIAVMAFAWQFDLIPGKVRSTEVVTAKDGTVFHVREVLGRGRNQQVQTPDGRWIPCRSDCEAAYRNAKR